MRDVYKPWTGESYSLEMMLEAGGRRYSVERDFARDSFVIRNPDTNRDISGDFDTDLSAHFLKLPRDDFRRVALISGKEVQSFSSSTNIASRLSALVEGSQDDTGAQEAVASLRAVRYVLGGKPVQPETALTRLTKQIEDKNRGLAELDAALESASDEAEALAEAQASHEELSEALRRLDRDHLASSLAEVREQIRSAQSNAPGCL